MESPVRIKIGVAVLIALLIGVNICNGYPSEEIKEQTVAASVVENSTETTTLATQTERSNDINGFIRRNKNVSTDVTDSATVSSVPSSTTKRTAFRGTTKYFATNVPVTKPKIIMGRTLTRFNLTTTEELKDSLKTTTEATTQSNEISMIQKIKETKLNETLVKLREAKYLNKTKDMNNVIVEKKSKPDAVVTTLSTPNKSEEAKSLDEDFNIDKYISDDFHDINNVYSQSVSPEIQQYIESDNSSENVKSFTVTRPQVRSTSSYYLTSKIPLTTPRSDYFDRKFKEVSESIKHNLADVDMDYANDENSTPDNEDSSLNVNFDDVLSQPLSNNSKLMYKNTREIVLNKSQDKNNKHGDFEGTNGTKILYEVSTVSSNIYEQVSLKTTTPEAENIKHNEITTQSNRNPKSSSSDFYEYKTESTFDRRNDQFRPNSTRKEYVSTTKIRGRTTVKPRIRISLKNNRNPTGQDGTTESISTVRGAEIVKMVPFTKSRSTLSTSSSKIDPVEITASEAIENFVSLLSKRGSTKFSDNLNETESTKPSNDSDTSYSIPPTAIAWELIKFKDVPFGKRNTSTNMAELTLPPLDNSIKGDSEEINNVNSTLNHSPSKPKTKTTISKKVIPTMEVGESNVEIVTSTSIYTTSTTPKSTTMVAKITNRPIAIPNNDVELDNSHVEETTTNIPVKIISTSQSSRTSSTKQTSRVVPSASESNEISKLLNHLTTQMIIENNNTTSTVGTEASTESMAVTEDLTEVVTTEANEVNTSSPSGSFPKAYSVNPSTNQVTTTPEVVATTSQSDLLTTTNSVESVSDFESTQSTRSFIDEYSTTIKPDDEVSDNKVTTENFDVKTTTNMDEEFGISLGITSKPDSSSAEASGDFDETTFHNVKSASEKVENPSTVISTTTDILTQATTTISRYTTLMSEKPTTRYITTLTTSLLPLTEDSLDSREGKNKVVSEEDDKMNNEDDWIDTETSNDTKNIDSNEIPLPVNRTESDGLDIEDNNTDNEIPKIVRNFTTPVSTSTVESNIEIIQPNTPEMIPESGERDSTETTTMFTEDGGGGFETVDGSGAIAAITISAVGIVALLLLVGILIVARGRRQGGGYGQRCTPVSLDSYSLDNVSVNGSSRRKGRRASKRSYGNPAYDEAGAISHPMQFAALANFALDQESTMNEFNEIPMIHARTDEVPPGCESKNRFSNVIPLPETRVSLKMVPGDDTSDYINANYVRGPKCLKKYYIACQAPMASTVNDFWRMIWEQNSRVVLMLTEYMENGMEKCVEYIPPSEVSDSRRTFGDYQIIIKKRDIRDKYVISQLQLKNLNTKTWREVTHMWYFWPAKGVPEECHSIIAFLLEARSYLKASQNCKEFDEDGQDSLVTHNGSYVNNVNVLENEEENSDVNIYNVQRGEKTSNGNSKSGTLTHSDGTKRAGPMVVHCSPGTGRTGTVIACDIGIRDFEMSRTVDVPKTVYRIRRDRANCVQTKDQYVFIYKVLSEYATKLTGGVLDSI